MNDIDIDVNNPFTSTVDWTESTSRTAACDVIVGGSDTE